MAQWRVLLVGVGVHHRTWQCTYLTSRLVYEPQASDKWSVYCIAEGKIVDSWDVNRHIYLRAIAKAKVYADSTWRLFGSVPMFPGTDVPRTYVPRYLCSPVPMFHGFCTLIIVVISINRLQILHTPWYDSRLWLCLGFRFRVLVRIRLELQTVFRLWLGCGLGLSLYG